MLARLVVEKEHKLAPIIRAHPLLRCLPYNQAVYVAKLIGELTDRQNILDTIKIPQLFTSREQVKRELNFAFEFPNDYNIRKFIEAAMPRCQEVRGYFDLTKDQIRTISSKIKCGKTCASMNLLLTSILQDNGLVLHSYATLSYAGKPIIVTVEAEVLSTFGEPHMPFGYLLDPSNYFAYDAKSKASVMPHLGWAESNCFFAFAAKTTGETNNLIQHELDHVLGIRLGLKFENVEYSAQLSEGIFGDLYLLTNRLGMVYPYVTSLDPHHIADIKILDEIYDQFGSDVFYFPYLYGGPDIRSFLHERLNSVYSQASAMTYDELIEPFKSLQ